MDANEKPMASRFRKSWISLVFVVLAALAAEGATTALWVNRTLLDTDRFMALIEPVIGTEEFASDSADKVAARTIDALGLEARLDDTLGTLNEILAALVEATGIDPDGPIGRLLPELPDLTILGGPIADGVEARVAGLVNDLFENERFRQTVDRSLRSSHRAAIAVLTEDPTILPENISVEGDVVVNLRPMIAEAIVAVGAAGADLVGIDVPRYSEGDDPEEILADVFARRGISVPDDFGYVTVITAESLEPYRGALDTLARLQWLLFALTLVFAAAAIYTNPSRIAGVLWVGIGVIVIHLVNWPITSRILDAVADGQEQRNVVESLLATATTDLRSLALIVILVAGLVVLGSLVAAAREGWLEQHPDATDVVLESTTRD